MENVSEIIVDSYILYVPSDMLVRAAKDVNNKEGLVITGLINNVKQISEGTNNIIVLPSEVFDNGTPMYRVSKIV